MPAWLTCHQHCIPAVDATCMRLPDMGFHLFTWALLPGTPGSATWEKHAHPSKPKSVITPSEKALQHLSPESTVPCLLCPWAPGGGFRPTAQTLCSSCLPRSLLIGSLSRPVPGSTRAFGLQRPAKEASSLVVNAVWVDPEVCGSGQIAPCYFLPLLTSSWRQIFFCPNGGLSREGQCHGDTNKSENRKRVCFLLGSRTKQLAWTTGRVRARHCVSTCPHRGNLPWVSRFSHQFQELSGQSYRGREHTRGHGKMTAPRSWQQMLTEN